MATMQQPKHFNILPLYDTATSAHASSSVEHALMRYDEVQVSIGALQTAGLKFSQRHLQSSSSSSSGIQHIDLMDRLGALFGFQADNVRNQREHVILLLANHLLRSKQEDNAARPGRNANQEDSITILQKKLGYSISFLQKKLLKNYKKWCSFLHIEHSLIDPDECAQIAYPCLYLLIWGEAANLRFMPECLCFIFHNMAKELNSALGFLPHTRIAIGHTQEIENPVSFGKDCFLKKVIRPIYKAVRDEAQGGSRIGRAPHSAWRNYDDMNEFFWSKYCFNRLGWPFKSNSDYLLNVPKEVKTGVNKVEEHEEQDDTVDDGQLTRQSSRKQQLFSLLQRLPTRQREREQKKIKMVRTYNKIGFKIGFVEQRSFWNIFHSFHRLWIAQLLILQILITLAFSGDGLPWTVLYDRDTQTKLLYVFITWAGLQAVQALLTIVMHFTLISRDTKLLALRMVLKLLASIAWISIFSILLARVQYQTVRDHGWSAEANLKLFQFLEAAAAFLLPEVLAILVFFMPWIANYIEKSEWKGLHALSWWFHTRTFVGRGLHQNLTATLKYTLFWLIVLCAKFSFSYFFQLRPLVEPTRELLTLSAVELEWHEFFRNHNRFVVAVLWAPVVLIYLMDTQIWYSIFSSVVGAMVGLFSHIGEIRNLHQFRLRFPFFASAITFTLLPEETFDKHTTLRPVRDMLKRLKIRYGFDRHYINLAESHTLMAQKFACLWNCMISFFREEDLVSNKEVELLEIPPPAWDIRVVQWPLVLLSNEVANALRLARKWKTTDTRKLWKKIKSNEYRKCAVVEAFHSLKYLLLKIIQEEKEEENRGHSLEERKIVKMLIDEIENSCNQGTFLENYKVEELEDVNSHVLELLQVILKKPVSKDAHTADIVRALLNLIDGLVRDLPKRRRTMKELMSAAGVSQRGVIGDRVGGISNLDKGSFQFALQLHYLEDEHFLRQLRRLQSMLSARENMTNVPKNLEARRRLAFFSNSLFMNIPHAPLVDKMLSFSVLTPYHREDVLYSQLQLQKENEDGISIEFYLQKIFPDEWDNYQERMMTLPSDEKALQLWASYRGQTLGRTVRGMMYYQHALEVLAHLENASSRHKRATTSTQMQDLMPPSSLGELTISPQEKAAALLKFTYVVTCQVYGELKDDKDARAHDILFLMKRYPAIRVAYVAKVGKGENENYYSVLVKYDQEQRKEVEVYRIELPGPIDLGEGKPENQNHAIIFTRGEALQTIDMNQDNCFEEALKVRNLLQEFTKKYKMRPPRILGIRENVFTGSVSSLAFFMSAQETSFVTLGQRVLANPLKIRMHYGHPDMFDRLWFLSRGGISKASRVINISEDIYAGFNCTLRGGSVTHHEYIQLGKGRDMGLNQITTFEGKIAGGNGEQVLSRDVYRLGHHLDFFRMFSFYYTTVGFYFSNLLVILAAYAFLWGRVFLGLSGIEKTISGTLNNSALTASLNQQFIVQIGLFTSLPMIVENSLENGFTDALWSFLLMHLQLCSIFYTFSLGTKGHYFGRTLLHGGAKYKATGRNFVVKREKFAENYRIYSRSHFVKGIELIVLLIIYETYGSIVRNTTVYTLLTFSFWFLALSWILGPFLFNPSGFDWLQTVYDYEDFQTWLWQKRGVSMKAEESWEVWWNQEQDHLSTTGFWGRVLEVVLSVRFFLIQYGMVYRLRIAAHNKSILVYLVSWTYIVVAIVVHMVVARAGDKYAAKEHRYYRAIQCFVVLFIAMVIVLLLELTDFEFVDLFLSLLAFLPTGWGLLCMGAVLQPFLEETPVWAVVVEVARLYEQAIGLMVMTPVAILSWLPGFQAMQTRILFNQAFSRGLQISRLLSGKKEAYRGPSF